MHNLRFTLDFAHCLVEVAGARGAGATEAGACGGAAGPQQSLVADRISSLSRDWRSADPGALSADRRLSNRKCFTCCLLVVAAMQSSWSST